MIVELGRESIIREMYDYLLHPEWEGCQDFKKKVVKDATYVKWENVAVGIYDSHMETTMSKHNLAMIFKNAKSTGKVLWCFEHRLHGRAVLKGTVQEFWAWTEDHGLFMGEEYNEFCSSW